MRLLAQQPSRAGHAARRFRCTASAEEKKEASAPAPDSSSSSAAPPSSEAKSDINLGPSTSVRQAAIAARLASHRTNSLTHSAVQRLPETNGSFLTRSAPPLLRPRRSAAAAAASRTPRTRSPPRSPAASASPAASRGWACSPSEWCVANRHCSWKCTRVPAASPPPGAGYALQNAKYAVRCVRGECYYSHQPRDGSSDAETAPGARPWHKLTRTERLTMNAPITAALGCIVACSAGGRAGEDAPRVRAGD